MMTLCDKCRGRLEIVTVLVELDKGEGATETEFEVCPRCKIVWIEEIPGYEVRFDG